MSHKQIVVLLRGGDRRSIRRSDKVAAMVLREPQRFRELIKYLWDKDPIVRMRAADAAEKVSVVRPDLLEPFKAELLGLLAEAEQIELRWHLALMVPRLALTKAEGQRATADLQRYLEDRSSIVRAFALQGLADLSRSDAGHRKRVKALLEESARAGTPAMKARARKLLRKLKN